MRVKIIGIWRGVIRGGNCGELAPKVRRMMEMRGEVMMVVQVMRGELLRLLLLLLELDEVGR